ncbi:UNVERIFIED_CONTAM: hypothetical protein FKN15_052690 [Acipenser sinensis]
MLVILLNCATLGMFQPCEDVKCQSEWCTILQAFDDFIFAFFAVEMVIKMIALGIFGQKCYLGDTWNRLDFFIVMAGMLEYSLDGHNVSLSAIRTVRVLRPLRAINRVPTQQCPVLLGESPPLPHKLVTSYSSCTLPFETHRHTSPAFIWVYDAVFIVTYNLSFLTPYYKQEEGEETPFICSTNRDNGVVRCPDIPRLKENRVECSLSMFYDSHQHNSMDVGNINGCINWNQYYNVCKTGDLNPHKGAINFDNIGYAWIAIFQVGSFFMINLCLVVIATQFSETKQRENQLMQEQRARYLSNDSTLASYSEPGSCYEELLKYISHLYRKVKRRVGRLYSNWQNKRRKKVNPNSSNSGGGVNRQGRRCRNKRRIRSIHHLIHHHHHHHHHHYHISNGSPRGLRGNSEICDVMEMRSMRPGSQLMLQSPSPNLQSPSPGTESVHSIYHADCHFQGSQVRRKSYNAAGNVKLISGINGGMNYPTIVSSMSNSRSSTIPKSKGKRNGNHPMSLSRAAGNTSIPDPYGKMHQFVGEHGVYRTPSCLSGLNMPCAVTSNQPSLLSCELAKCPYCASVLDNPELDLSDSDSGDSDVVYEFTQDLRRGTEHTNRQSWRKKKPKEKNKLAQCWDLFCQKLKRIVENKLYDSLPKELTDALEISNIVFTSMFALEMLLKLLAFGLFGYIKNPYNIFDGIIVIISVWEIIGQSDGGLSVLRTFRLLRVLKLVRFLPALRRQLVVLMKTMDNVATFCMLLMLFIFIFSILGMHLFGCKFSLTTENGDTIPDRKNFDSLLWAIVTVFQLTPRPEYKNLQLSFLEVELKMYSVMMTANGHVDSRASVAPPIIMRTAATPIPTPKSSPFMDSVHTFNESRRASSSSIDPNASDQRSLSSTRSSPCAPWGSASNWGSRRSSWNSLGRAPSLKRKNHSGEHESLLSGEGRGSYEYEDSDGDKSSKAGSVCGASLQHRAESLDARGSLDLPELLQIPMLRHHSMVEHQDCNGKALHIPHEFFLRVDNHKDEPSDYDEDIDDSYCFRIRKMLEPYKPEWCKDHEDWSLYLFSPQNQFRVMCQKVISHKMFDHVVLVFIFLNCITIALERPDIQPHSTERVFLSVSNHIFTAIFVTETTVKLFKGKFYYCDGFDTKNITNKSDCLQTNYRWIRRKYNFDNLGQALMSLFVLSSKDGWVNIMYDGLDAVGIDQQPVRNHNPWMLLFFISFLLIVSFFVLNMFVGVVVENFHKCRQHQEAEEARLREEKRLQRLEKKRRTSPPRRSKKLKAMYLNPHSPAVFNIASAEPHSRLLEVVSLPSQLLICHQCTLVTASEAQRRPYYANYSPARLYIHTLCTSHYLDLFITFIIGINVVTMSMEHYHQPKSLDEALKYCNYVFTIVFVFEAILKLVAFGFRRFFKDRWNQLDLSIVLLSIMGITLEEIEMNASLPINPTIIRIMRVLRIARVLKLLKMATGMRALLDTVVQALPQVGNLGLLFMLLFFIYAALGVELFGKLICNDENPCEGLSRHATFENFGMAFLTLFRVSTGDNWNGIMKDTLRECSSEDKHCLSYLPLFSPVYFVTFVLIAQFVLVNVVVAVLMKHLEESNKEAKEDAEMDAEIEMEISRRLSASAGGRPLGPDSRASYVGPRPDSPVQDGVRCGRPGKEDGQENLLSVRKVSVSRMHSLPNDSYMFRPVKSTNTPYPLTEVESFDGELQSGSVISMQFEAAEVDSLLHVPVTTVHSNSASPVHEKSSLPKIPAQQIASRSPSVNRLLQRQEAIKHDSFDTHSDDLRDNLHSQSSVSLQFKVPVQSSLTLPFLRPMAVSAHSTPQPSPLLPRRSRTSSVHTHRLVYSQHSIPSRPSSQTSSASPVSSMFDSVDPTDEEVQHINSSAKDWSKQSEAKSHSLSLIISPTQSPVPLKNCCSTTSLAGANMKDKDLKKFYSVDTEGFLAKPSWTDDPRRHSIEICPSIDDGDSVFDQSSDDRRRSSLHGQSESPYTLGTRRKKKMSPPCISIDPPLENENSAPAASLTKVSENSMLLRRRTPSSESTLYRDSLDLLDAQPTADQPSKSEKRISISCRKEHLSIPQFSFDQSDIGSMSSLSDILSDSDQSTPSSSISFDSKNETGAASELKKPNHLKVQHTDNPETSSKGLLNVMRSPLRKHGLVRMVSTRDEDTDGSVI